MPEARVGVRMPDDRQSVNIEIGPVEGPSAPIVLNLEQLTKVINFLGQARMQMLEGQRIEPLDGTTVTTINNSMWYVRVAKIDGSLLAFNHPAYRPVVFALPREDVARIVGILTNHLAFPVCQPDKPS